MSETKQLHTCEHEGCTNAMGYEDCTEEQFAVEARKSLNDNKEINDFVNQYLNK